MPDASGPHRYLREGSYAQRGTGNPLERRGSMQQMPQPGGILQGPLAYRAPLLFVCQNGICVRAAAGEKTIESFGGKPSGVEGK